MNIEDTTTINISLNDHKKILNLRRFRKNRKISQNRYETIGEVITRALDALEAAEK